RRERSRVGGEAMQVRRAGGVDEVAPQSVENDHHDTAHARILRCLIRWTHSLTTRPGLAIERGFRRGGVPEWLKGTDCKSVGARLRWFESNPLHQRAPASFFDRDKLPRR